MNRRILGVLAGLLLLAISSGCAAFSNSWEGLERAWQGVPATMSTYTQQGGLVDQVKGNSFRITRDERFDSTSTGSDGSSSSNKDSQVLLISLGKSHISHVGSTMVLAQDGLTDVTRGAADAGVRFENTEPGMPWLNDLIEKHRNLWAGKGKTIMVRSQDGTPVAIYAGNQVEIFATDIPKSTQYRVDGQYLLVYRADITVYDNDLLGF